MAYERSEMARATKADKCDEYIYTYYLYKHYYVENTAQDEWLEKQRNLFTVPKQKFLITLY